MTSRRLTGQPTRVTWTPLRIYGGTVKWINLQKKWTFSHDILTFWGAPVEKSSRFALFLYLSLYPPAVVASFQMFRSDLHPLGHPLSVCLCELLTWSRSPRWRGSHVAQVFLPPAETSSEIYSLYMFTVFLFCTLLHVCLSREMDASPVTLPEFSSIFSPLIEELLRSFFPHPDWGFIKTVCSE